MKLLRVVTLGTPAGTACNVGRAEKGDPSLPAAGLGSANVTRLANLTSEPTTYDTAAPIDCDGFPSTAGFRYCPVPEERPCIAPNEAIGIYLASPPGSLFKCLVMLNVLRIGN